MSTMASDSDLSNIPPSTATRTRYYAGIDIGGTNIKLGILDDLGNRIAYRSIPTQQEGGPAAAAERSAKAISEMASEARISEIRRVGLATPGPMDLQSGMLICPGNLPAWHNTPIRDLFSKATGVPVTYANDANAAAWGEYWRGAGAEYASMVMLTLGTGVGGGIVLNEQLVEGQHSCGAEIGHIIIDASDDAPINSLGIRGSLEGYCGAYGVVGQAERLLEDKSVETSLRAKAAAGDLTPKVVAIEADAGDAAALSIVMNTAKLLAIGVVTCAHMVDPNSVVIGGGLNFGGAGTPLGDKFIEEVRAQTRCRLIPTLRDKLHIDFALLGGDAGFTGAAGLARRDDRQAG
ncbi:Glucokinase [Posidoniimonas polymericola]|uniref:Glucokinase n=1 Tax=Posidoniimonas polymericola TaxID=2528002 RepID=A0A5C5YU01_9BACT|nr:ROK family protein [Posidoniimonas polymericola]TWT78479.1 Glucokinase [Posidoniimonas polymericola]